MQFIDKKYVHFLCLNALGCVYRRFQKTTLLSNAMFKFVLQIKQSADIIN